MSLVIHYLTQCFQNKISSFRAKKFMFVTIFQSKRILSMHPFSEVMPGKHIYIMPEISQLQQ